MNVFQVLGSYFSIIWDNIGNFPILNTGLTVKSLIFGSIGLSVLFGFLRHLFSISSDSVGFSVGKTGKVRVSESRKSDER